LRRLIAALPLEHGSTHSLVAALMTGERSGLTAEQTAAFRDSGASHILALSGLHLGVIYLIISKLLSVFGNTPAIRRMRSALIVLLAGFYTLATGAGPSIVRAFLFILIRETCSLFPERRTSPVRILMTALTLQLAFRPEVITSLGFQLSYLAMTGITILYPHLSAWYPDNGRAFQPVRRIWQAAALAVSCQIFTAPLAWIRFHNFPKYFILTNLLALPLTSALMAASVAAIALQGLGGCPAFLAGTVDFLAQSLLFVLDVISGM
ncbi:MAG: ComEC/Rec2 family competence protein, partial [Bacteroidales bacterium]|nr:ComEC/Rec2 family competence protein [Bacteroidales bacterium]